MSAKTPAPTEVQIFGATYQVRGADGQHVQELAGLVDEKMREVAEHLPAADTARVAILAALNLADELLRVRKHEEGERVEIEEKVTALTRELAKVLRG